MVEIDAEKFRAKLEDITSMYPFCPKITDSLAKTYWDALERFSWEQVRAAIDYIVETPEQTYRPTVGEILRRLQSKKTDNTEKPIIPPEGGFMRGEDLSVYIKTRDRGYEALRRAKIKGQSKRHVWMDIFMRDNLPKGHRMVAQHGE